MKTDPMEDLKHLTEAYERVIVGLKEKFAEVGSKAPSGEAVRPNISQVRILDQMLRLYNDCRKSISERTPSCKTHNEFIDIKKK